MDDQVEVLRTVSNGLIILSAVITSASVVIHTRVPWWHSEMGRHLMAYMAVMAAVLDLSALKILFGDSTTFALLRLVVFVGVPLVTAWRLWLQIKAQRRPTDIPREGA